MKEIDHNDEVFLVLSTSFARFLNKYNYRNKKKIVLGESIFDKQVVCMYVTVLLDECN